jgi:hypothetical protein
MPLANDLGRLSAGATVAEPDLVEPLHPQRAMRPCATPISLIV